MLKVLLVDDEPFVVQGLSVLIDWEAEGFEIAGTAANGQQALAFLKGRGADLVLADIRMPVMDGLELLRTIRTENCCKAYFVILSGYSDFHFAQRALRHGCTDYFLKPVQQTELIALLKKVKGLYESSRTQVKELQRREKAYLARNVIAMISGKYDHMNLEYVKNHLSLTSGLCYVDIEIDETRMPESASEEKMRAIQRQMYENCLEYLGNAYGRNCIFDVSGREDRYDIGLLFSGSMAEAKSLGKRQYLEALLKNAGRMTGVQAVMFVGCQVEDISDISKSYRTAAVAKSFCTLKMDRNVTYYEEEMKQKYSGQVLLKRTLDDVVRAIEQNEQNMINQRTKEFFYEMDRLKMDSELVELNINYLMFQLIHLAVEQDKQVNQSDVLEYINSRVLKKRLMWGSEHQLKEFLVDYATYLVKLRQKVSRGPLADIERDIQERYMENITLKELSAKYYVNTAYLGRIFKKKYGMSFKDYLNQYRMEQAASMLLRTDRKVYEIAVLVGYRDLDYFIDRFIKLKGCTPAKFRKQSMESNKINVQNKHI